MAQALLDKAQMRTLGLIFAVLVAGAAASCSSDGSDTDNPPITGVDAGTPTQLPDGGPPTNSCEGVTLEVGTGNLEFTPVSPGDTVYLFRGPQGGYMVYIGVRARGIDPTDATLCYRLFVTTTSMNAGEGCWHIQLPNDLGDGVHERVGVWGQLDPSLWTCPSCVRGKDVQVDVTLSDTKGCSATGGWSAFVSPDAPM